MNKIEILESVRALGYTPEEVDRFVKIEELRQKSKAQKAKRTKALKLIRGTDIIKFKLR